MLSKKYNNVRTVAMKSQWAQPCFISAFIFLVASPCLNRELSESNQGYSLNECSGLRVSLHLNDCGLVTHMAK